ncbi:MAG: cytochrome P460 family protein [Alphaproteobacteria bacterium]
MKKFIAGIALASSLVMTTATAQDMMEFGSDHDIEYAALLWDVMNASNLAGPNSIQTYPYEGIAPHGMMLQTFYTMGTINGHTGDLIVKRNYGPEGVSEDEVLMDPAKHLGAITVMFRREADYDADNQDWFWAKFLPDGSLDKNAMGGSLAGRVAKGADEGCIACHSGVDDYVFTSDAITMMK